jgi:hypothetical protein
MARDDAGAHSDIRESSNFTSLTMVGAMYFDDSSISPPNTIVPLVILSSPDTRLKALFVINRAKLPDADGGFDAGKNF